MKKGLFLLALLFVFVAVTPCLAATDDYRIEVLQVTDIEPFQKAYTGFLDELAKNGIISGKNLTVKRTVIDFDIEKGGLWDKIGVARRISSEASRIAKEKPDLVLTIGTPATQRAKDKIIAAGIPVVFTAVSIPTAAGCKSLTEAGPGFTGSTIYMDMNSTVQIIKAALPNAKTIGLIHSDDENALAQAEEAKKFGASHGINFLTRQVKKSDKIVPHAKVLDAQGAQAFIVPLDTYYGLRKYEASRDLHEYGITVSKKPAISLALMKVPGAVLYVGSDFGYVGGLSGRQAAKILKEGVKPDSLPILRQKELNIMVDKDALKEFDIQLPLGIMQLAKSID